MPAPLVERAKATARRLDAVFVRAASLIRQSPMLGDVDMQAAQRALRRANAALRLRAFEEWGPSVLHDEDRVLGVNPAGFSEDRKLTPYEAAAEVREALDVVTRRRSVLRAQAEAEETGGAAPALPPAPAQSSGIRVQPGTAFIMMMMDRGRPELEDVKRAIQEEFARFDIKAVRADDIEHSGEITNRILDEIRSAEFLIADLTGERQSVYYEVGFAHAMGKRPILYCKAGTTRHFDLSVHNCPEYSKITELRELLNRRLTAVTRG
jgi:hypothetical protein